VAAAPGPVVDTISVISKNHRLKKKKKKKKKKERERERERKEKERKRKLRFHLRSEERNQAIYLF